MGIHSGHFQVLEPQSSSKSGNFQSESETFHPSSRMLLESQISLTQICWFNTLQKIIYQPILRFHTRIWLEIWPSFPFRSGKSDHFLGGSEGGEPLSRNVTQWHPVPQPRVPLLLDSELVRGLQLSPPQSPAHRLCRDTGDGATTQGLRALLLLP